MAGSLGQQGRFHRIIFRFPLRITMFTSVNVQALFGEMQL